jgi:hypothetical protein
MANADHVRRITAMLHTNGCTPAEAQGRLAKARQIAEREGLLGQFPQLRTAKAKASAAHHSAKAAQAPRSTRAPNWGGYDRVEINGVEVDLANLSAAGLEVLAALLRKQQQEQSARNYNRQRGEGMQRSVDAYLRELKKEEDAERANYFQAQRQLWTRLAVAIAVLLCALLVNRLSGGPLAFIGGWAGMTFMCCAIAGLQYFNLNDEWYSKQRAIEHRRKYAMYEYGYTR